MGKIIKNPFECKIMRVDGETITSLHYGLSCEEYPELEIRKGFSPELNPQELAVIEQVINGGIAKIKEHEGIA